MQHVSDLVGTALDSAHSSAPPVRSLMDIDFYKFTMGRLIFEKYLDVEVGFKLIVRSRDIHLGLYIKEQELRDALDHARSLSFTPTDMYWMRGIDLYGRYMFSEPYLEFLRGFKLPRYDLKKIFTGVGDACEFELTFPGSWVEESMWETIALAIISELYYRGVMRRMKPVELRAAYTKAADSLYRKLEKIAGHPKVTFADFGQRRRHSFLWQQFVLGECKEWLGQQFTGTSNTWMAFHHGITPIGTNAHELPMVLTALADTDQGKLDAQYKVIDDWEEMYGEGLRIFLPDTYGTAQFLKHAPAKLADWRGFRQDSGDPIQQTERYITWLTRDRGERDATTKLAIFSDGLDVDEMIRYQKYFDGQIKTTFGWGTLLTNDFRGAAAQDMLKPFSMVCKVVSANGRPAVKLSDNPEKATGPADAVAQYKRIFGTEGQNRLDVTV